MTDKISEEQWIEELKEIGLSSDVVEARDKIINILKKMGKEALPAIKEIENSLKEHVILLKN
jgi:hypothetical protein